MSTKNSHQEEHIIAEEKAAWREFQKAFWPRVARQSAESKTHPKLIIWIVAEAFRRGMNEGIKMAGNAVKRELNP